MPSTVIFGMVYSPARRTLDVVFRGAAGVYRYKDVAQWEWQEFRRAPSKGTYLNATFKARHPYFEHFADERTPPAGNQTQPAAAGRGFPDENVWGFYD